MKLKKIFLSFLAAISLSSFAAEMRYVGGDISLLPIYEEAGTQYKDQNGNNINLLPFLKEQGMNAMRVRLFVDPESFASNHSSDYDPNACQSLPFILPLCQDILDNGFDLMLDFHYSDTWADPGKQWIPKAWEGLSDVQLVEKIYEYTKQTLVTLKEHGIEPSFIQPGNEISYGMLWVPFGVKDDNSNHVWNGSSDASWKRFGDLLRSAIKACREECPDAQIVIHTERVAQVNVLNNFYQKMAELNIDYDIIGLSYYPYFHTDMAGLNNALSSLEEKFPSMPIMIVETGFPYAWEVPGTDQKVDYPYSTEGQNEFAQDLVDTLLAHKNVNGLFWWWLEYNAYGAKFTGPYADNFNNWYNAPLFDSRNGQATPALKTICSFGTEKAGLEELNPGNVNKDERWVNLYGQSYSTPISSGLYIHNGKVVMIKK